MTGRGGKNYYHLPKDPSVTIGVSLSITPSHYESSSQKPLYIVLTARILTSPQPDRPITFATWNNPFSHLGTRSFTNITCKTAPTAAFPATSPSSPTSQIPKFVEIWPRHHWPKYGPRDLNVREYWKFLTILPGQSIEVRHEVPQDRIDAANLDSGEVYSVELTDLGLGTSWWMYGTMDEVEGKKFIRWSERDVQAEIRWQIENVDVLNEMPEDEIQRSGREWILGEDPAKLALVVEKGDAKFEVV